MVHWTRGCPLPRCRSMRFRLIPLTMVAAMCSAASAKAPPVQVHGWARAGVTSSAAYVTITNRGAVPDRLVGVSTPAAQNASIHNSVVQGGISRMRGVAQLPVAARSSVVMKPGGLHVMLTGLRAPLRPGARVPLTLRFARAGAVQVSLPVLPPGADRAGGAHHGH